jgi:hypothetical protein
MFPVAQVLTRFYFHDCLPPLGGGGEFSLMEVICSAAAFRLYNLNDLKDTDIWRQVRKLYKAIEQIHFSTTSIIALHKGINTL